MESLHDVKQTLYCTITEFCFHIKNKTRWKQLVQHSVWHPV